MERPMRRQLVLVLALLGGVVAATAAVVGVASADRDFDGDRMGPGMMAAGTVRGVSEPAYLAEMVAHHEDAVTAARELARSDRPRMRALGASIVRTQTAQIEQMTAWLREWYPDQPAADYRPMMRDLSGLSGDRLDRAFLEDMIPHHMVAVMMSQRLLVHGTGHAQVADLARSIRNDQHAEIRTMQRWLVRWFGGSAAGHMGMGMRWGTGNGWDRGNGWGNGWGMARA
jgi:uncharacterized protein (DUF305 family)